MRRKLRLSFALIASIFLIACVVGCGTITGPGAPEDTAFTDIAKYPSFIWKAKGVSSSPMSVTRRNDLGREAIGYSDQEFYAHYEGEARKPEKPNQLEIAYRLLQWALATTTTVLSWEASQLQDNPTKASKKNEMGARVGLGIAAMTSLWALRERLKPEEEDKSGILLKLEKNRRSVRDCITHAMSSRSVNEYPFEKLLQDVDWYYKASGESTIDSVHIWKLNCL